MEHEFDRLDRFLRGPGGAGVPASSCGACTRLMTAVNSDAGPADLAVLVRQVLQREAARRLTLSDNPPVPRLSVPRRAPWPVREVWESAGVRTIADGSGRWSVSADEWRPTWLAGADTKPPNVPLALPEPRRPHEREVQGDPVLAAVNRTKYRVTGQRDSMRAILTAPAGATLLVNLPTGAGKSLCAQLPAVLDADGLTIVVVPTTALCIDQEKAVHERLPALGTHGLAYYSTPDGQRNRDIRHRIRQGEQRIVFTSPEALSGSLAESVYIAAEAGRLQWLVVDEAHTVEAWGDEFRPAFQELAGLRRDLMRVDPRKAKFRTLLLSATVTGGVLQTLQTLFGDPGPFGMAAAVQLRPEIAYWRAFCPSEPEQRARVLEAVMHLPRPAILYATRVDAADAWRRVLSEAGFRRLDVVTGRTSASDRERILGRWRTGQTDLVVGTSAFGLGVDQQDVRAVIHACVPENLDRYYQEVGRGGRDGKACLSLVLDTARDTKDAAGINGRAIISVDLGLPRWTEMFRQKVRLEGDRYRVPLSAAATFGMAGDYHESWNARLLNLMARAGLIALDFERPPPPPAADAQAEADHAVGDDDPMLHARSRVIRVLDPGHLERAVWDSRVEPCRVETARSTRRYFDLLKSALNGRERCIADTLAEMYAIPGRAVVSGACGGCAYCRGRGDEPWATEMPLIDSPWPRPAAIGAGLAERMRGGNAWAVFYDPASLVNWKERILPAVHWLTTQGVRNVVLPLAWREDWASALAERRRPVMLYEFEEFDPLLLARAGTLVLHPPQAALPEDAHLPTATDDPRVIMLPEGVADPSAPHRALRDVIRCPSTTVNQLTRDLGL